MATGDKPQAVKAVKHIGRTLIRRLFGDGVWRSVTTMTAELEQVVPGFIGSRKTMENPRLVGRSLDKRITSGIRRAVTVVCCTMLRNNMVESKVENGEKLYRLIPERLRYVKRR
jgi:hypothetical protein